jgi:hypothetical protein
VKGAFMKLDGNALRAKQEEFRDVSCIVLDEYACTSQEMLAWIASRCRQFKVCNELFGGLSVIMVGDPAQLPPVGGVVMYSNMDEKGNSISGLNAYLAFKKVFLTPSYNFQGYSFG